MELKHDSGIDVVLLSPEEAVRLDHRAIPPGTDVVRVGDPSAENRAALAGRGFVLYKFAAVRPNWRERSLQKILYLEAAAVVREAGFHRVSCGNGPNLYGWATRPSSLTAAWTTCPSSEPYAATP